MQLIEKETYINFNDAEPNTTLCTYNAAWLRKMDNLSRDNPSVQVVRRADGYGEYSLPKKWVKVKIPRKISEEEKASLTARLKSARKTAREVLDANL